jgi:2-polyprenyl-6-methoxyphenol hydroxylase-like FAD-dependent oxidoreductase
MSPIGGVGVNLAVQDAVASANILAEPLRGRSAPSRTSMPCSTGANCRPA